ncbi:uncharacterized protein LOC131994147 isoform X2 [Stomoxys calcitrans]|uniref:uncharacterized protein LOC131994147 isoform X2 n=1 Tax=Stomoxys calcitrans TaxID=35570 RepID=UPI0027E3A9B4|nr:uncharacterized protein LOC131994147 isoform X2 [Stomoxys calcitrans]
MRPKLKFLILSVLCHFSWAASSAEIKVLRNCEHLNVLKKCSNNTTKSSPPVLHHFGHNESEVEKGEKDAMTPEISKHEDMSPKLHHTAQETDDNVSSEENANNDNPKYEVNAENAKSNVQTPCIGKNERYFKNFILSLMFFLLHV